MFVAVIKRERSFICLKSAPFVVQIKGWHKLKFQQIRTHKGTQSFYEITNISNMLSQKHDYFRVLF